MATPRTWSNQVLSAEQRRKADALCPAEPGGWWREDRGQAGAAPRCPVGAAAHRPCPWVWMGLTYLLPAARTQMLLGETKSSVHLGPSLFTAAEWERAAAQRGELLLGDSNSRHQASPCHMGSCPCQAPERGRWGHLPRFDFWRPRLTEHRGCRPSLLHMQTSFVFVKPMPCFKCKLHARPAWLSG